MSRYAKQIHDPVNPTGHCFGLFAAGRKRPLLRAVLGMLALFLAAAQARGAEELLPPFGFRWNDSMPKVEAVLHGAKARIVAREKKENREIWTVEGLVHPGLKRTLFTFKQGSLFGVELQYEYPDRTIEWYNDRMGTIRRYFDAKFGTGKLVSRSRDTDSDVVQTLVGYQWMVGTTMLELFYFSAERGPNLYRYDQCRLQSALRAPERRMAPIMGEASRPREVGAAMPRPRARALSQLLLIQ